MGGMIGCRRERVVMAGEKKSQQKANSNGNGNEVVIQWLDFTSVYAENDKVKVFGNDCETPLHSGFRSDPGEK